MTLGMNRNTGAALDGNSWLSQAVADILTTPVGTRVMRRDYGSLLPTLIDQPMNGRTVVQIYAATAQALARWLPALKLTRVNLDIDPAGSAKLLIEGHRTDTAAAGVPARIIIPLGGQ